VIALGAVSEVTGNLSGEVFHGGELFEKPVSRSDQVSDMANQQSGRKTGVWKFRRVECFAGGSANLSGHGGVLMHPGDNRFWLSLLLFGACSVAIAADPRVSAGGIELTLPGPRSDFAEAGDKLRTTFFELLVPSNNRLLTAYVPEQTLANLNAGKSRELDIYSMVEVPRRAEYTEVTPQAFEQVLKGMEPSMGTLNVGELQQEMNTRLKSLGTRPIEIGHPEMLGGIFRKSNAAGFPMLLAVKQDDRKDTMAGGMAVLRVKQRLVFAYLYRKYESPDTISWVRKNLEVWCDAILAKNS
jgi:hypothetical protein